MAAWDERSEVNFSFNSMGFSVSHVSGMTNEKAPAVNDVTLECSIRREGGREGGRAGGAVTLLIYYRLDSIAIKLNQYFSSND